MRHRERHHQDSRSVCARIIALPMDPRRRRKRGKCPTCRGARHRMTITPPPHLLCVIDLPFARPDLCKGSATEDRITPHLPVIA